MQPLPEHLLLICRNLPDEEILISSLKKHVFILKYDPTSSLAHISKKIRSLAKKIPLFKSSAIICHGTENGLEFQPQVHFNADNIATNPTYRTFWKILGDSVQEEGTINLISCNIQTNQKNNLPDQIQTLTHKNCYSSAVPIGRNFWTLFSTNKKRDLLDDYFTLQVYQWNHLLLSPIIPALSSTAPYFDGITTKLSLNPLGKIDLNTLQISMDLILAPVRNPSLYDPMGNPRYNWQTILEFGYADGVLNTAIDYDPITMQLCVRQGFISSPISTPRFVGYFNLSTLVAGTAYHFLFIQDPVAANGMKLTVTNPGNISVVYSVTSTVGAFTRNTIGGSYSYSSYFLGASLSTSSSQYFHGKIDNLKFETGGMLIGSFNWNVMGYFDGTSRATPPTITPEIGFGDIYYTASDAYNPTIQNLFGDLYDLQSLLESSFTFRTLNSTGVLALVTNPADGNFQAAFKNAIEINRLCRAGTGRLLQYVLYDPIITSTLTQLSFLIMITGAFPNFITPATYGAFANTTSAVINYPSNLTGNVANLNFMTSMELFYNPNGSDVYSVMVSNSLTLLSSIIDMLCNTITPVAGITQRVQPLRYTSLLFSVPNSAKIIQRQLELQLTLLNEQLTTTKKIVELMKGLAAIFKDQNIKLGRSRQLAVNISSDDLSSTFQAAGDEWVAVYENGGGVYNPVRRIHFPLYAYAVTLTGSPQTRFFSNNFLSIFLSYQDFLLSTYQQLDAHLRTLSITTCSYYSPLNTLLNMTDTPTIYPPSVSLRHAIANLAISLPATLPTPLLPNDYCNPFSGPGGWLSIDGSYQAYFFPQGYNGSIAVTLTPYSSADATAGGTNASNNSAITIQGNFELTSTAAYQTYNQYYWLVKWYEDPNTITLIQSVITSLSSIQEQQQTNLQILTANYKDSSTTLANYTNKMASLLGTIAQKL